ncbi:hypothetical protein GCM10027447_18840 [Glycomyces halotolerans]
MASAAVAAGAGAWWGLRRRSRRRRDRAGDRRLAVTVNAAPEEADARVRERLAALGMDLRLRIAPAAGGRGTEVAVRMVDPSFQDAGIAARVAGSDPRQRVREALRDAKSLVETGEVLRVEETGPRGGGIGTKLVEAAGRRAGGEGRL